MARKKASKSRAKPNFFKWLSNRPRIKAKNKAIKAAEAKLKKLRKEKSTITKAETAKYKRL